MKTAISIPDNLFIEADELADRMGLTRSGLYAMALERFMASQRSEDITRRLNEVYATEDSSVDPVLRQLQFNALPPDDWS